VGCTAWPRSTMPPGLQRCASEPIRPGFEFRHGPRALHEPVATEWSLARRHLYRFNLLGAVERTKAEEKLRQKRMLEAFARTQREGWKIQPSNAAPPLWRREAAGEDGSGFHAMKAPRQDRSDVLAATAPDSTTVESEAADGRVQLGIMQDPQQFPNPRAARVENLSRAIAELEDSLVEARIDKHRRVLEKAELAAPPVVWDQIPTDLMLSEHRLQYYPRSLDKVRTIGTGRDPRWARPYDNSYKFREMMFMQKGLLSRKV